MLPASAGPRPRRARRTVASALLVSAGSRHAELRSLKIRSTRPARRTALASGAKLLPRPKPLLHHRLNSPLINSDCSDLACDPASRSDRDVQPRLAALVQDPMGWGGWLGLPLAASSSQLVAGRV